MRQLSIRILFASAAVVFAWSQGCGDSSEPSIFNNGGDDGGGGDGSGDDGGLLGDDGGVIFGDGGTPHCVNLQCQQVSCPGGGKTTVSGKVYDPAGVDPLYNVIVYVPNAPVQPFKDGASCDKCGALASGSPIATAITDPSGSFTLENVPVGSNIPLVLQIGKWRRQITIPSVAKCTDTPITDKNLMRLPKNKIEGDIPLMAIATGGADPFECLLQRIGIDNAEFTVPSGNGRIRYYQATGGTTLASATPSATTLWGSAAELAKYDIVLLPCEGDEYLNEKPAASRNNVETYTNQGGRLFTTHYGYAWLASNCSGGACGTAKFGTTGVWNVNNYDVSDPLPALVNMSFPKGLAFAQWLQNVGATTTIGNIALNQSRHDLDKENAPTQMWMTAHTTANGPTVQHITFNTPIGVPDDQQCGRVVYSDFHVSATDRQGNVFPASCKSGPLTPQEKALEFMLFDLSSCIQKDTAPPAPPPK